MPNLFRRRWKTSEVVWETCPDGSARVRPLPDVMQLFGAAGSARPKDVHELNKARVAMARGRAGP